MAFSTRRSMRAAATAFLLMAFASTAPAQLLQDAVWFEREVGGGIIWHYYQFDDLFGAKQSVSYMEADLSNPNTALEVNYREAATGPNPAVFPRARTSVQAQEITGAKAAINGTFFNTSSYDPNNPNAPWGGGVTYLKVDGTTIHNFDGSNINSYGMGILFDNKTDLEINRKPGGGWNSIDSAWENMMINGPVLLEDGVVESYDAGNTFANARHPRSAIGLTGDNRLILMTVDGRTSEAAGMSCTELASVLKELGCQDAINLDGGGSTTLWAAGEPENGVVNYPSDNGAYDHQGERSCANILAITSNGPVSAAWDGRLNSLDAPVLARSGEPMTVTAVYTNIGTETWTADGVAIVPSRDFGRNSEFVPDGSEDTFFTMEPSTVPPGSQATFTLDLVPPGVNADTVYTESFALEHETEGYFGPPDNALRMNVTVRPELTGAPPAMIVQGTPTGPNNQWYFETSGNWSNSSVSFTAPGVSNSGTQRYVSAFSTGREAAFRPIFDVAGVYTLEAAFPSSTNSIEVEYNVNHQDGTSTFTMDQHPSAGMTNQWNMLGEFSFGTGVSGSGGAHSVTVGNPTATGNRIYSGAVRFDFVRGDGNSEWVLY